MSELVVGGIPIGNVGFTTAVHWAQRVVVVAASGDLDALTAPGLTDAIHAAARKEPTGLVVDLSNLRFLGSAGINVLLAADREMTSGARFGVVADGPATSRPLRLIGIDDIIAIYPSLDEALADFVTA
jgi:anti-sigma B factor antagonist